MMLAAFAVAIAFADIDFAKIPKIKSPKHEIGYACLDIQSTTCRRPMTPGNWKQMKARTFASGKTGFAVYKAVGKSLEFRANEESIWIMKERIHEFYPLEMLPFCEKVTDHKWQDGQLMLKMNGKWFAYSMDLKLCAKN